MGTTTVFLGSEQKLNVNIQPIDGELSMQDYDFEIVLYCNKRQTLTIKKEDCIFVDKDNYIAAFDTNDVGEGTLKYQITAYIPDTAFADRLRTEVVGGTTNVNIVNGIK